ncbi:MAG: hypothetical protein RLZZ175_2298 [Bacteroidota bacterium]|jgi:hypothetical protein
MAGSGFHYYSSNVNTNLSIEDKLIPDVIFVGSNNTTYSPNDNLALFEAIPNKYHKCTYGGSGGSARIGINMPPVFGNKGKWFAVEDFYGLGVQILASSGFVPYFIIGGPGQPYKSKAYFHCNGEEWVQTNVIPFPESENLFKLIPSVIYTNGTGIGWDSPSTYAVWEAVPNKLNKCIYGYGGSTPIRVIFPPIAGNQGKWFGIQKASGVDVYLPIEGLSGNHQPILTYTDGYKPTAYYHCTNEGWQLVSILKASPDLSIYELLANKELVGLDNSVLKYPNNNVVKNAIDAINTSLLANCNDIRNTFLAKAGNLSGLSDYAIARQNLGVEGINKKGVPNGYPSLDANGTIPSAQLPSYVDDVLEFASVSTFPLVGVAGKIYLVTSGIDANKSYRWSGSTYVELVSSPGSTDAVAEGTVNKYWTNARTIGSTLIGFVTNTYSAITSSDTILSAFQKIQGFINSLSSVAFSGNYNDLINKPTIPSGTGFLKYFSTINRSTVTGSTTSLGTAWIIPFTPLADMSITQIGCLLTNANASERVDMAIYNASLTTNLGTAFSTFNSIGEKFVTLSSAVNLVGGTQYFLVLKGDNLGANNYANATCFSNSLFARQTNLGAGAITGSLATSGASTVVPFISIK